MSPGFQAFAELRLAVESRERWYAPKAEPEGEAPSRVTAAMNHFGVQWLLETRGWWVTDERGQVVGVAEKTALAAVVEAEAWERIACGRVTCDECEGRGKIGRVRCEPCGGSGRSAEERSRDDLGKSVKNVRERRGEGGGR